MAFVVAQEYQTATGSFERSAVLMPVTPPESVRTFMRSPDQNNVSSDANPMVTTIFPLKLNGILLSAPTVVQIIINNGVKSTGYSG